MPLLFLFKCCICFCIVEILYKTRYVKKQIKLIELVLCAFLFLIYSIAMYKMEHLIILDTFLISITIFTMALFDINEKAVPTILLCITCILVLMYAFYTKISIQELLLSCFIGSLPLLIIKQLIKDSVGMGDVYLMVILGMHLKIKSLYMLMSISYFLALLYCMYLLKCKKANRKTAIAMFPFFYMGYIVTLLFHFQ